jgi:beta-phosphoglucomutase
MIKAVIFDLDGVIVSTDDLHYEAWKTLADKEGIFFSKEINNLLRGVSRKESLEIILKNASKEYTEYEKNEFLVFKNEIYKQLLIQIDETCILPNVMNVLTELKKRKIKIAIGSSSKNAKTILKQIGLIDYFDVISDGTNITKSKPDPEVFVYACNQLGLKNEECCVVEDAISGLIAAKSCGMMTFATGDALHSELKDYKFSELLDVIV